MGCLDRLEKPVCIIAHNGLRFDFPILQAEIQKIGKVSEFKWLPNNFICSTVDM